MRGGRGQSTFPKTQFAPIILFRLLRLDIKKPKAAGDADTATGFDS